MKFVVVIGLIVTLLIASVTKAAQISFNALQLYGVHYFARRGDNVELTCEVPESAIYVDIYKVDGFYDLKLVEQSVLRPFVGVDRDKYHLNITSGENVKEYILTIRNVDGNDMAIYGCRFCDWVGLSRCICPYDFAVLYVVEDMDTISDRCILNSGLKEIFFIGDELLLNCTEENLQFFFNGTDESWTVMSSTAGDRHIYPLEITDERFNGTKITCIMTRDSQGKDYCEDLPQISVFASLEVKVTPESTKVTDGENISFICKSSPLMPSSLEWYLSETEIMFDNISTMETRGGSRLTIENIDFRNLSQSSFEVRCNITIGSRNAEAVATIYKKIHPTTASLAEEPTTVVLPTHDVSFVIVSIVVVICIIFISLVCFVRVLRYRRQSRYAFTTELRASKDSRHDHTDDNIADEVQYSRSILSGSVNEDKYDYVKTCMESNGSKSESTYYENANQ